MPRGFAEILATKRRGAISSFEQQPASLFQRMKFLSGHLLNFVLNGFIEPVSGKQAVGRLGVIHAHSVPSRLNYRHVFSAPVGVLIGAKRSRSRVQLSSQIHNVLLQEVVAGRLARSTNACRADGSWGSSPVVATLRGSSCKAHPRLAFQWFAVPWQ